MVTLTEVLTQPIKQGNKVVEKAYRAILSGSGNFTLVPITADIAERAAELRAQYNLKTPDALQVATAIVTNCDAFVTNDLGIKRVKEVRILLLDELELDPP
jgi:predicted nucleic acid-binding protein